MTYSEIQLTFKEEIAFGGVVSFSLDSGILFTTSFVTLRVGVNQATIVPATSNVGESTAIAFVAAFNLDHNVSGANYIVTRNINVVTIKCNNPLGNFGFGDAQYPLVPASINVLFTYNNFSGTVFEISAIEYEEALTSPCEYVRLKVTTNELATDILSPVAVTGNTNNPYYVDILRSGGILPTTILVSVQSSDEQTASRYSTVPNVLAQDNVTINVNNSPSGATLVVVVERKDGLTLEYSLDNTTWQTSNVFDGVVSGSYTMYVRDQLGCSVSKTFTIDEFGVTEPYTEISKSNSMRWVKRSVGGVDTDRNIDEHRLSREDKTEVVHEIAQRFLDSDTDTTQIKSNFETNTLKIYKPDGNFDTVTPVKITNNLRLKDRRDARKFDYGDGRTGVYFRTGKTYDYDTGIDLGADYTLNGGLPEWAVVDNYIRLETSWFQIKEIQFVESVQAEVIIIENTYTGADVLVDVSSLYNRDEFEVYEFTVDFSAYSGMDIYGVIEKSDPNFDTVVWQSEYVRLESSLDDYVEIIYANDTNTDVNYSNGIRHRLRLRAEKIDDVPIGNKEDYTSDTTSILTEADVKEAKEFVFEPVTRGMMVKLFMSLFHRKLYINGVGYVVNEVPEVEGGLEESNLYEVKAKLKKIDRYYNAKTFDNEVPYLGGIVEMPSYVSTGTGFLKIS